MNKADPLLMRAQSARVAVSPVTAADVEPYRFAVERSARRIGVWNPVNPRDLEHHLSAQSETHRSFMIRALQPHVDAPLVGIVNVTNVVRGRFMSATMGYNAFDPYAGTGMFGEGLRLVVDIALRDAPAGMGLHRVEANVQVGNAESAGVLRSLGFRRERTVRRMLWLADGLGGPSAWRDHDSFAVTREEWPAAAHRPHGGCAGVLVVGDEVSDAFAVSLAQELGGVALVDVPFEAASAIAQTAAAPLVWSAGTDADRAVVVLTAGGSRATRIDRECLGQATDGRSVTRVALAVRPYLS